MGLNTFVTVKLKSDCNKILIGNILNSLPQNIFHNNKI